MPKKLANLYKTIGWIKGPPDYSSYDEKALVEAELALVDVEKAWLGYLEALKVFQPKKREPDLVFAFKLDAPERFFDFKLKALDGQGRLGSSYKPELQTITFNDRKVRAFWKSGALAYLIRKYLPAKLPSTYKLGEVEASHFPGTDHIAVTAWFIGKLAVWATGELALKTLHSKPQWAVAKDIQLPIATSHTVSKEEVPEELVGLAEALESERPLKESAVLVRTLVTPARLSAVLDQDVIQVELSVDAAKDEGVCLITFKDGSRKSVLVGA